MAARKPRLHKPVLGGEELEEGFQILDDPRLPSKEKPGPGDEYVEDENGKARTPGELASGLRLTPGRIEEMRKKAAEWISDPVKFAEFGAEQSAVAIQIAADIMVGPFIGPSANQQRLASAQFVVKEAKEILDMVVKMKGASGKEK